MTRVPDGGPRAFNATDPGRILLVIGGEAELSSIGARTR